MMINAQIPILPQPAKYTESKIIHSLSRTVSIVATSANLHIVAANILEQKSYTLLSKSNSKSWLLKLVNNGIGHKENYTISTGKRIITITGGSEEGIYRGLQSLGMILPAYNNGAKIAELKIEDQPQFGWRGIMLDVSRHFFTVEEVKKYIDVMAMYKFNVLHWHLTDDEGWRIEIKSLPKLTQVGAWRVERDGTFGSRPAPQPGEPTPVGGFYTQEQIKEIVGYAATKFITIVPEIDVPGHSMAALAAYPELSTKKEPKMVSPGFKFAEWYGGGKFKMLVENTLNPADEKVYTFLDQVFSEVAALFPGEYIHVGGDECYHGYWEEDPAVKKFMEDNKIAGTHELQSYFMKRTEKIISKHKKKMIGWDEILDGGLADGAAVMSWRGIKGGLEAASKGHKVVMTPTSHCYIDYTQGDHALEHPIYADLSLKKVYEFNPIDGGVNKEMVLGGQVNLWTEHIPHLDHAMYMTYPRAIAMAEKLWSPASVHSWEKFTDKLLPHIDWFEKNGLSIAKTIHEPKVSAKAEGEKKFAIITNELPGSAIYYTLDNTPPSVKSKKYTGPIALPENNFNLRVQCAYNGKMVGRTILLSKENLLKRI
jgi:hexosaminidase